MSSKNLGLLSIAFSFLALVVWALVVRVGVALFFLVFSSEVAAIACAIFTALRESRDREVLFSSDGVVAIGWQVFEFPLA